MQHLHLREEFQALRRRVHPCLVALLFPAAHLRLVQSLVVRLSAHRPAEVRRPALLPLVVQRQRRFPAVQPPLPFLVGLFQLPVVQPRLRFPVVQLPRLPFLRPVQLLLLRLLAPLQAHRLVHLRAVLSRLNPLAQLRRLRAVLCLHQLAGFRRLRSLLLPVEANLVVPLLPDSLAAAGIDGATPPIECNSAPTQHIASTTMA